MSGTMSDGEEFVECDTCRAKPGSPYLCEACLIRRTNHSLRGNVKELEGELKTLRAEVKTLRNDMRERCNERNMYCNQMEAYREIALAHAGVKP